ncbi:MAG: lysozyme [Deltaproteobacteria bacterium]|nr:lysozyme [Deltaproteobacteria bacterium]
MDARSKLVRYAVRTGMVAVVLCLGAVVVWRLFEAGIVWFVYPSTDRFPIRGVDVSHHQGTIDWKRVAASGLSFAYIKASEGSDLLDPRFAQNWDEAQGAGLRTGAYHFFTFASGGRQQASNYLAAVSGRLGPNALPPVVDLEFGGNSRVRPDPERLRAELTDFVEAVETALGHRVVFYMTSEFFEAYPLPYLTSRPLWIRSIYGEPDARFEPHWKLWQYHCRARVPGIAGPVDLNVLRDGP